MGEIKWLKCPSTGVVCEHCVMESIERSDGDKRQFKKCAKMNKLVRKNTDCPLEHVMKVPAPVEEPKLSQREKFQQDYLKERNEKLKVEIARLEKDNAKLKEANMELVAARKSEAGGLEAGKKTLADSLQVVTEDRDRLWAANHTLDEEAKILKKQVLSLEQENEQLDEGSKILATQITKQNEQVAKHIAEIQELKERNKALEDNNYELSQTKKNMEADIERMKEQSRKVALTPTITSPKVCLDEIEFHSVIDWRQRMDRRTDQFLGIIEKLLEREAAE